MKKLRYLAGALALSLLVGCAGQTPDATPTVAPEDDMALQAAGISRDMELVTVDGKAIRAEDYLFWLAVVVDNMAQYGMITDDASWERSLGEMTVSELVKSEALETAKLYRIVANKAEEYGVTLTQEQEDEFLEQINDVIENVGGEEGFRGRLDGMCISEEGFLAMNRVHYLHDNLQKKLEEEGKLTVTPEELAAYKEQFIEEKGLYGAKHILISTRRISEDGMSYEDFSEEERAQAEALAQDLRRQLREAEESEELFDRLMNEYSEDGRDDSGKLYAPDGYTMVYAGQMVPEFEQGAMALEVGQISEPIKTDYGYHIILRIPVDQAQVDAAVEQTYNAEYKMSEIIDQWLKDAEVTTSKAYDELDPKTFYTKLNAILEERQAAQETPEPEESQAAEPEPSPVG